MDLPLGNSRKFIWQNDLKVNVPDCGEGEDGLAILRTIFLELLKGIKIIDKDLLIIPYKDGDIKVGILWDPTDLPERFTQLKYYFHGLQPMLRGSYLFVKALLGHNIPIENISKDLEFFTQANKAGIFWRQLSSEDTERMEYLLYSIRSINTEDFKDIMWKNMR